MPTKKMLPDSGRPNIQRAAVLALLASHNVDVNTEKLFILGLRGYYRDSMGKVGVNDIDIYDDAIVIITPTSMQAYNANLDPTESKHPEGRPTTVCGEVFRAWKFALHHGKYPALCQRGGKWAVIREKTGRREDSDVLGINWHCGGNYSTGSEGCKTHPPAQWALAYAFAKNEAMRLYGKLTDVIVPYMELEYHG